MIYADNLLPKDAVYYEFNNASISNGTMYLRTGGSVKYTFTKATLAALTEYFRIAIAPTTPVDRYRPTLFVYVHAITSDNVEYYFTLTPTSDAGVIYLEEIKLEAAEYKELTFTVYSTTENSLILWEMCPEAADSNVEVIIDGVKQSLPRLLYDYNTEPVTVDKETGVIGLITFNLKGDTDLQGHLEVGYTASEDCVLTIRVNDTGVEELYTPILYDIKAGRGNIALPHAYLNRHTGYHTTYVTAQVSSGEIVIGTRGLLYTIDGGYLAERLIDAGIDVLDFSIEQSESATEPNNLWLVGIDASECFVRSRPYDADETEGFTPRYSLGFAKAAALEFDGVWVRDTSSAATKFTLITDKEPYVFWVDADDNLYCQLGDDEETKFLVDTDVTTVSACRGFSSILYREQDQGLVVLYVKNGVAMYRNYCYVSENRYTWQGPFTIDLAETVISAYVHRLNDYRLSFTINTATNNYWYLTSRTYVTQATPVEQFEAITEEALPVVAVYPANYEVPPVYVSGSLSSARDSVIIEFSKPIYTVRDLTIEDFESDTEDVELTDVSIVDEYHIRIGLYEKNYMGLILSFVDTGNNLRYLPLEDRHVPVGPFTVTCPAAEGIEEFEIKYTAQASVAIDGARDQHAYGTDTVNIKYTEADASVEIYKIENYTHSATPETFPVTYNASSASVVTTQTGVEPI